jgi:hypothetical protein
LEMPRSGGDDPERTFPPLSIELRGKAISRSSWK